MRTARAAHEANALDAFERGRAAADAGDRATALRWIDRARRLVPLDQTVALTWATLLIGQDDGGAARAFAELAASGLDRREVWLGLATARLRSRDAAGAAAAMARLLGAHACAGDDAVSSLAGAVAHAAGSPGWCAIGFDGALSVIGGAPTLLLDDCAIPFAMRLPSGWETCRTLRVEADGKPLLGSPISLARIRATEGFAQARDGGIAGWAWHPADPARTPVLRLLGGSRALTIVAEAIDADGIDGARALMQARRFFVSASELGDAGLADDVVAVETVDGQPFLGSPVDPGFERRGAVATAVAIAGAAGRSGLALTRDGLRSVPADVRGPSPPIGWIAGGRAPGMAVVIPVHDGGADALACLDAAMATVPAGTRVILVDDASRERAIVTALDRLARKPGVRLLRYATNRGFVASANAGMREAAGRDVILLNSDTLPPPGWVERLRAALRGGEAGVGTASPLSNDATILSYPATPLAQPMPDAAATARLSELASRVNGDALIDIPTTVGFCMAIRADCLAATGLFREDVFAQGYGEENDFCLRARHLGWRHVAVTGLFVAHRGGASFGPARAHLVARNMAMLERLHPGYSALISAFAASDPLHQARRRLDLARFRAGRRAGARSVVLVTHDGGGGTERVVGARIAAIEATGDRAIVLRPVIDEGPDTSVSVGVRVCDGSGEDLPDLRFLLPAEMPALLKSLRAERPALVEMQHLLGHHESLLGLPAQLGVPYWVHTHDYALFCPRIALVSTERRYCGEPPLAGCEACIADLGSYLDEPIGVAALRARSARLLAGAARVISPSADAAARFRRHFPMIVSEVVPLEPPPAACAPNPPASTGERVRCAIVGALGTEKGYDVLLAAARDAAARDAPIEFIVVGHTTDDARLLDTGRVFVTGKYRGAADGAALLAAQRAHVGWLPSVWPETWCFALGEMWAAGLDVVCFDLGAPAERVRASGRGRVLPIGLPTSAIVDALLAAGRRTGDECARVKRPRARA